MEVDSIKHTDQPFFRQCSKFRDLSCIMTGHITVMAIISLMQSLVSQMWKQTDVYPTSKISHSQYIEID